MKISVPSLGMHPQMLYPSFFACAAIMMLALNHPSASPEISIDFASPKEVTMDRAPFFILIRRSLHFANSSGVNRLGSWVTPIARAAWVTCPIASSSMMYLPFHPGFKTSHQESMHFALSAA